MIWEDGRGAVYFAREVKTGRLTALRLQPQDNAGPEDEKYALGQTRVLTPLATSLGATGVRDDPKPLHVVMASTQRPIVELTGEPNSPDSLGVREPTPSRHGGRRLLLVLLGLALLLAALLTFVLLR
jgi:hypothetical protein